MSERFVGLSRRIKGFPTLFVNPKYVVHVQGVLGSNPALSVVATREPRSFTVDGSADAVVSLLSTHEGGCSCSSKR